MKKILAAIFFTAVVSGNIYASESAIDTLKSGVSPAIMDSQASPVPPPPTRYYPPHHQPPHMVHMAVLTDMVLSAKDLADASQQLTETRDNLPKAALTYITGVTTKKYDGSYTVKVIYALRKSVPANSIDHSVQTLIFEAESADAQQKLWEARDNLGRVGLTYINGSITPVDERSEVKITYAR